MEKLKVGIIGSGFIAEHHALAYAQLQNVDIIGVSSVIEDQAKVLMAKYKIPGKPLKDYKELLKLGPDVVSVCLPNYLHKDVTADVLQAGAHALVEKPLARNVAEGKAMIDAEKKSGKKIFYCENNMYAPTFVKVKEIVDEGALGKIYMGRGKEQHSGPHSQWFYKKEPSGGGALVDLGIHDIACLVWYLGCDVKKVFCQTTTTQPNRGTFGTCEVEDNAVGILYFENGAQVVIEESWCAPGGYDMRFELFGTDGQLKVAPTFSNLVSVYSEKGYGYAVEKASSTKGWTFPVPAEAWNFGYPQEVAHFVDCVINKKEPLTGAAYGLKILNIVETMYKSAASGRIEAVPSI
ncbi:MAG: Gfo/Idh/MocA family protein [Candidatus Sigynarchaeota archaeon]